VAHQEVDDVAARPATKAVEVAVAFIHQEARSPVVVKGTAAGQPAYAGRAQFHAVRRHHRREGVAPFQRRQITGQYHRHLTPLLLRRATRANPPQEDRPAAPAG